MTPAKEILIVDDEVGIRELLSEILRDEGHDVTLAENAACAREIRARTRPDLVLLDVHMPVMDGKEAIKRIRASAENWRSLPVIMVSADAMDGSVREATTDVAIVYQDPKLTTVKVTTTFIDGETGEALTLSDLHEIGYVVGLMLRPLNAQLCRGATSSGLHRQWRWHSTKRRCG